MTLAKRRDPSYDPAPARVALRAKMARERIRYFVTLEGAQGKRHFWKPSRALRDCGFALQRLSDDRGTAIAEAEQLNRQLDAWRAGDRLPVKADRPGKVADPYVRADTLAWVIRRYRASRFWTVLKPRTQRGYNQNIKLLEDKFGDLPVTQWTPQRVEKLYASMFARTPAKAKAVIVMLQILLKHAAREGLVTSNAAAGAGLVGAKPSGIIWPVEAVMAFAETADRMGLSSVGTAVMINHWLGQRQGDILSMQRTQWRDGRFWIKQSKTGARVSIPENAVVRARVELELERHQARLEAAMARGVNPFVSPTLLVCEATRRPWDEHGFRHAFADVRATLATTQARFTDRDGSTVETLSLQFLHLRHTAVTEMALAGCTPIEIAGFTGHSLGTVVQILKRYLVMTAELADSAARKRTEWEDRARREREEGR